jgi:isopentenyl-diphosphate delta-isomerase type 1
MKEEYFDIVDTNDLVIGRELRRTVHAQGLWHRAVHIFVYDEKGRIFLQKRSMAKDMAPGLWDSSCSGHVDSGEEYNAAARRELGEELGLKMTWPPARWFRVEACAETGWEFVWVYRLKNSGPFVLHPEEIERGGWFTPAEVTQWMADKPEEFAPAFKLIWGLASKKG